MLVEFMIENRGDIFGEETPGLSCPSAQESPAPMAGSTGMRRNRGLSQTGAWHTRKRNGEKTAAVGLWVGFPLVFFTSQQSLCCPGFCFLDLRLEEQSGPAGRADKDRQATACLDASPSLLDLLKEAGGDTLLQSETAEVRQLHNHGDNGARLGGQFLLRPSTCCASAWQPVSPRNETL